MSGKLVRIETMDGRQALEVETARDAVAVHVLQLQDVHDPAKARPQREFVLQAKVLLTASGSEMLETALRVARKEIR